MKALVTGANGMLGQDLCPILEDEGYEVVETDIQNLDITNPDSVQKVLKSENPDVVIHCAAYTDVDSAEENLEQAREINADGTKNIAKTCAEIGCKLVYISTDYVFDGKKEKPYLPTDEPNPINNYGLTKLEGEEFVKKYCEKYFIVRTSWLYGIYGKNFVETMLSLKDKPELKVVNDQIGCPTWTLELANEIAELLDTEDYGIYHICGGGKTSWYSFAKRIFELSNLKVNLKPCTTEEFPRPAKRPKYSVMDNDGFCRNWEAALKEYLQLREV